MSYWSYLEVCLKIGARNKKNEHFGTDGQSDSLGSLVGAKKEGWFEGWYIEMLSA